MEISPPKTLLGLKIQRVLSEFIVHLLVRGSVFHKRSDRAGGGNRGCNCPLKWVAPPASKKKMHYSKKHGNITPKEPPKTLLGLKMHRVITEFITYLLGRGSVFHKSDRAGVGGLHLSLKMGCPTPLASK